MNELIVIGTIVKPQGIKGEVKIIPYTDDLTRFYALKSVYIDNGAHTVEKVRTGNNEVFIKFKEIPDRNTAESYRGKDISILRSMIDLPEGRYLIRELLECDIVIDGEVIAHMTDIFKTGSADVYEAEDNSGRKLMFPALKDLIIGVDILNKRITLDKKRFEEVSVYED